MSEEVKPYSDYSSTDFFENDRYIRFVLHPSEDEARYWDNLAGQYHGLKAAMEEAKIWILLLNRQKIQPPVTAGSEIWHRIAGQMRQVSRRRDRISSIRHRVVWPARVAAVLSMCWVIYEWSQHGVHRYQTDYGITNRIDLPDGSLVTLNGKSSIQYKRGWSSAKPRELWLQGEAFFQVKHVAVKNRWQQSDSFRVHVDGLNVTVTGTQFNIKSRRSQVEITLLEGGLRIDKEGEAGFTSWLRPGEVFVLDSIRKTVISTPANAPSKSAWTKHELDLDGYSLEDVLRILEDSYGYEITLRSPELAQKRLTGTIPASSGEDIIFVIEKVFNVTVNRDGKRLMITKY